MDVGAITVEEAESLSKNLVFERFYETWEKKREKRGDPTPEVVGQLQADELTELERSWELDHQKEK